MTTQSGPATLSLTPVNPWALVPALGNLDAYIAAANRLPLLTHEQEQRYARQFKEHNDLDAAGRLLSPPKNVFTITKFPIIHE